jgi:quercetin dioxygenase-like cupin family protein
MKAEPPEVVTLKDAVQYAQGSIVSKTVLKREIGSITLFAFDAGQGLSEHTAPFDAVVQVLDGRAELIIGGQPLQVSEGQMMIMPANIPHAVKANQPFKMLLTMIRG